MSTASTATSAFEPDDDRRMVINNSPLLALVAALGDLSLLKRAYTEVVVPYAVAQEVMAAGQLGFGVEAFMSDRHLSRGDDSLVMPLWLLNSLDIGEAAVVATALSLRVSRVCIDETVGRRVARLAGLQVTGLLGVLIKLKSVGAIPVIAPCVAQSRGQGIWLSDAICSAALHAADERV